jgi:hypothetical protein
MPGILENVITTIQQQRQHQKLMTNTFHVHHLKPEKIIPIEGSKSNLYVYTL